LTDLDGCHDELNVGGKVDGLPRKAKTHDGSALAQRTIDQSGNSQEREDPYFWEAGRLPDRGEVRARDRNAEEKTGIKRGEKNEILQEYIK
jgi:hypothetical protein